MKVAVLPLRRRIGPEFKSKRRFMLLSLRQLSYLLKVRFDTKDDSRFHKPRDRGRRLEDNRGLSYLEMKTQHLRPLQQVINKHKHKHKHKVGGALQKSLTFMSLEKVDPNPLCVLS